MENTQVNEKKAFQVPEKFLDKETGEVQLELLVKSYMELEKKLSSRTSEETENLLEKGTRPQGPEEYKIEIKHQLFEIDRELNKTFFENGFTNEQVQLVYNLAEEKMIPMIVQLAEDAQAEKEVERLIQYFGGEQQYREISRQILAWGQKNMKADVLESMSGSYDGVVALYKMMQNEEPKTIKEKSMSGVSSEKDIQSLVKDPRYWRDRDPAFVEKVTAAFKDFYTK